MNLTIDGVTKPDTQWAEESGIPRRLLRYRVAAGWGRRAITTPVRTYRPIPFERVEELRRRVEDGESVNKAADSLGITRSYAKNLVQGIGRQER